MSKSECNNLEILRQKIKKAKLGVQPTGNVTEGVRLTLETVLDYLEFMVTPCEDCDEDE